MVSKAAAHKRRVLIPIYDQRIEVFYNAGSKYRVYQQLQQKLDTEYNELNRRLSASEQVSEEDYQKLMDAMAHARRRLADNICTVIESWDLEANEDITLDDIKASMSKKDQKRFEDISGSGGIPVDGAWLDALPLPDEFIIEISSAIANDFNEGGAAGKALSAVS